MEVPLGTICYRNLPIILAAIMEFTCRKCIFELVLPDTYFENGKIRSMVVPLLRRTSDIAGSKDAL